MAYAFAQAPYRRIVVPEQHAECEEIAPGQVLISDGLGGAASAQGASASNDLENSGLERKICTGFRTVALSNPLELCTGSALKEGLQIDKDVIALNLYPRTQRDLAMNKVLLEAAQSASFDPTCLNELLGTNLFGLILPSRLATFLCSTTAEGLDTCVLEVLSLIAEDETDSGLAAMERELEPSVWEQLERYRRSKSNSDMNGRPRSLVRSVETLLRMCYLTPWRISVNALHVPPERMACLIDPCSGNCPCPQSGSEGLCTDIDMKLEATFATYWSLLCAWHNLHNVLVLQLGISGREVATALLDARVADCDELAWAKARLVVHAARAPPRPDNLFATLPLDVVKGVLAPHVLWQGLLAGNDGSSDIESA